MEEILASIRRIISEDDAPAEPKAEAESEEPASAPEPESEDDVLELTDVASDNDSVVSIGDIDAYEASAALEPVAEPEPLPMPSFDVPEPVSASGHLVSDVTASTAATAFSTLSSSLLMPKEGRTIEDLLRELLQPMLKQWLDANLPAIVEEQVRQEVERISRQSRR